jgi:hypothetical protein
VALSRAGLGAICTAVGVLAGGCGGPGGKGPAAARAGDQVRQASTALMAALVGGHVTAAPRVRSVTLRCPRAAQSARSDVITAKARQRASMVALDTEVTAVLRASGWRVAAVPATRVPAIMPLAAHPIDDIAKGVLRGAVNILPDPRAGAYALIFINSGCRTTRPG